MTVDSGTSDPSGEPTPLTLAITPGEPNRINQIVITGAIPGETIALGASLDIGTVALGGCSPSGIGDLVMDTEVVADAAGMATVDLEVPPGAGGTTQYFQAVSGACLFSPVAAVVWSISDFAGDWPINAADVEYYGAADGDVFGSRVLLADVNGSGTADIIIAAPHADPMGASSGAAYVLYGIATDVGYMPEDANVIVEGSTEHLWLGFAIDDAGDVDGNGVVDLIVGTHGNADEGTQGAAWVIDMPRYGGVQDDDLDVILTSDELGDEFGGEVGGGFDVDEDGLADLVVSAPHADVDGETDAGVIFVFRGPFAGPELPTDAETRIAGIAAEDTLGWRMDHVDTDGDGVDELWAGASGADGAFVDNGRAYGFGAVTGGLMSADDAQKTVDGDSEGLLAGSMVGHGGDLDGDGMTDLLVGAKGDSEGGTEAGALLVLAGPVAERTTVAEASARRWGTSQGEKAGAHAAVCDFDRDGQDDLFMGAHQAQEDQTGALYLYWGPVLGDLPADTADVAIRGVTTLDNAGQDVSCGGDVDGDSFVDVLVGAEGATDPPGLLHGGGAYLFLGPGS